MDLNIIYKNCNVKKIGKNTRKLYNGDLILLHLDARLCITSDLVKLFHCFILFHFVSWFHLHSIHFIPVGRTSLATSPAPLSLRNLPWPTNLHPPLQTMATLPRLTRPPYCPAITITLTAQVPLHRLSCLPLHTLTLAPRGQHHPESHKMQVKLYYICV